MIYTRDDILRFLHALDTEVSRKIELIIIGGASLSLAYNFNNMTVDVDLLTRITIELSEAIERARDKSHLQIMVSTTSVRAEIRNMGDRLFTPAHLLGFQNLIILIPEKHDLALMKAARNEPKDIEDIQGLHARDPLDPSVLMNRFKNELLPLNSGDDELLNNKFLEMIESLFGEGMANDFETKLII